MNECEIQSQRIQTPKRFFLPSNTQLCSFWRGKAALPLATAHWWYCTVSWCLVVMYVCKNSNIGQAYSLEPMRKECWLSSVSRAANIMQGYTITSKYNATPNTVYEAQSKSLIMQHKMTTPILSSGACRMGKPQLPLLLSPYIYLTALPGGIWVSFRTGN